MQPRDYEWVSVNDMIPEKGQDVLVYAKAGYMRIMHYAPKTFMWYPGTIPMRSITHWMILPEPPYAEEVAVAQTRH